MKLFRKPKSKFCGYDFTVRGHRYRGSTQETKSVRALQAPSLKMASMIENIDPLSSNPTAPCEFAERFLFWKWVTTPFESHPFRCDLARNLIFCFRERGDLTGPLVIRVPDFCSKPEARYSDPLADWLHNQVR